MAKKKLSEVIVQKILEDLQNRRGLRQEWDMIDMGTQREIQRAWEKIVREALQ